MTIKSKKFLLKTILESVFIIVAILPVINWHLKNKILNKFAHISMPIYKEVPDRKDGNFDLYFSYCDTVIQFVNNNPIELDFNVKCKDDSFQTDTLLIEENRKIFIEQVQKIYSQYRRSERRANYLFWSILIIAPIPLALMRKYINKKFQEKKAWLKSDK